MDTELTAEQLDTYSIGMLVHTLTEGVPDGLAFMITRMGGAERPWVVIIGTHEAQGKSLLEALRAMVRDLAESQVLT